MGNRTETGTFLPHINPKANPYLHIIKWDGKSEYQYVPSLTPITVHIGQYSWTKKGVEYSVFDTFTIDLLPPIEQVPPPQFDTDSLISEQVSLSKAMILEAVRGVQMANIVALSHGVYWGFLPEECVARILIEDGYNVLDGFPRTGGRKRIQEHGILLGGS